jgi:hypothetical protein
MVRDPSASRGNLLRRIATPDAGCRATHVSFPVTALLRRADAAAVTVSALAMKATRRVGRPSV